MLLKKKVLHLESEIKLLKMSVSKNPDFSIDEKNWEKVKSASKKTRKGLFKKIYG